MKKAVYLILIFAIVLSINAIGQRPVIELTFTAKYQMQHVVLDSIFIQNLTQPGDTMLYPGDTILYLNYVSGINENEVAGKSLFAFSEAIPNPVIDGETQFLLSIPEKGSISIRIIDLLSQEVTKYENILGAGNHSFNFFPGKEKYYLVSAIYSGEAITQKILNANSKVNLNCEIVYKGKIEPFVSFKSIISGNVFAYSLGDKLRFTGYARNNAGVIGSSVIESTPVGNENYLFEIIEGIRCPDIPSLSYEGQTYNTVQIGNQCWLKENLNVGKMIDGSQNQTNNDTIEKYCWDNNASNCEIYGGLYQWDETMQYSTVQGVKGICPEGWHIPVYNEWIQLRDFLGGENFAGGKIKEPGFTHWIEPNVGATNETGFTGLPGGDRYSNGHFWNLRCVGVWWSSSENSASIDKAWGWCVLWNVKGLYRDNGTKTKGFSVRCIRNSSVLRRD